MRDDIIKYLGTVMQSTAKTISQRVGMDQLDVARELNHMHADGVVEREKKQGGGNEYHYWLTRGEAKQSAPIIGPSEGTGASVEIVVQPAALAQPNHHQQLLDLEAKYLALQLDADTIKQQRDAYQLLCDELKAENESLEAGIAKLRENNEALEKRIDDLTGVDPGFKPNELYVTVGRYAKPKRHKTIEKAQRRASSLVRAEKESEVLVCEPIGRVIRGSEWRPA